MLDGPGLGELVELLKAAKELGALGVLAWLIWVHRKQSQDFLRALTRKRSSSRSNGHEDEP